MIDEALGCIFLKSEVMEIPEFARVCTGAEGPETKDLEANWAGDGPEKNSKRVFPCEPNTPWEKVEITLVDNNTVRVKTPQGEGLFTYHQLGMADRRKGDSNTKLWRLFVAFAKLNGVLSSENLDYARRYLDSLTQDDLKTLPKTANRLNTHLKSLFDIKDSVYKNHYRKEKAYKMKIRFFNKTHSRSDVSSEKETALSAQSEIEEIFREAQDKKGIH